MIDALFGSKTRVKLLHLFFNNPEKAYYVREITRTIDEQINSVRRELANLLGANIITSNNVDNKLYYEVNPLYEHYLPLEMIFSEQKNSSVSPASSAADEAALPSAVATPTVTPAAPQSANTDLTTALMSLDAADALIATGSFVDVDSAVDLVIVSNVPAKKISGYIKRVEKEFRNPVNYVVFTYDEFCYRLSVRDRFLTDILDQKHNVMIDKHSILK